MNRFLTALLMAGLMGTVGGLLAAPKDRAGLTDQEILQGQWKATATKGFAKDVPAEELQSLTLTFKGSDLHAHYGKKTAEATYKLIRTEAGPSQIDVTVTHGPTAVKGKTLRGIYLLEDGTLKILYRGPDEARPETFMDEDKHGVFMVSLKKEKR